MRRVSSSFQKFHLERHPRCIWDAVSIYNGESINRSQLIGRYCGYSLPPDVISSGSSVVVKFVSDAIETSEGFVASYVSVYGTSASPSSLVVGFLIREPFTQLPSSHPNFSAFESSSITLQLPRSKISVYTIYRPPSSSPLSKPNSVFLEYFQSFLSLAATTPHEFIITGDFNTRLDNPVDHLTSQFLSLLSSFNLTQRVNCPTHNKRHILDFVITSCDCSLAPSLFIPLLSIRSFLCFTTLSINPSPLPPPTLHSFRLFHRVNIGSFLTDLKSSRLITHPPKSLGSLFIAYNTTLSSRNSPDVSPHPTHRLL